MCNTILRVTYIGNDVQDINVDEKLVSVAERISDLQFKDTVQRIEMFSRVRNLRKTTTWEET